MYIVFREFTMYTQLHTVVMGLGHWACGPGAVALAGPCGDGGACGAACGAVQLYMCIVRTVQRDATTCASAHASTAVHSAVLVYTIDVFDTVCRVTARPRVSSIYSN